jgi:hypothetical protein
MDPNKKSLVMLLQSEFSWEPLISFFLKTSPNYFDTMVLAHETNPVGPVPDNDDETDEPCQRRYAVKLTTDTPIDLNVLSHLSSISVEDLQLVVDGKYSYPVEGVPTIPPKEIWFERKLVLGLLKYKYNEHIELIELIDDIDQNYQKTFNNATFQDLPKKMELLGKLQQLAGLLISHNITEPLHLDGMYPRLYEICLNSDGSEKIPPYSFAKCPFIVEFRHVYLTTLNFDMPIFKTDLWGPSATMSSSPAWS